MEHFRGSVTEVVRQPVKLESDPALAQFYWPGIVTGLALNDNGMLLAGAVPAAVLALLVQGLFEGLDRWLISPGLRQ